MKVIITRTAQGDLIEIGAWVARDKPIAANRLVSALSVSCERLSLHPERYPVVSARKMRKRPLGDYVIFYRVAENVEIVRILHGARDWVAMLDEMI